MFSWDDLDTFVLAFFVVFPIVAIIHAAGHKFFIWLFGGEGDLTIGKGKALFQIGSIHFHILYFVDSACNYYGVDRNKRWKQIFIHSGGILFNGISVAVINYLIIQEILPKSQLAYQFVYFSIYYIFFAILPIDYTKDNPSDGKAIFLAWKQKKD